MTNLNTMNIGDNNKNLIIQTIKDKGPISRADISRELKISKPSISKNVKDLIDANIIIEIGQGNNDLGRKSTLLVFNSMKAFVIGVDIGNFKIRVGLANLSGEIIKLEEREIFAECDGEVIIQKVDDVITHICYEQQVDKDSILAICIGLPCISDEVSKKNYLAPFINNWEDFDISAYFSKMYSAYIIIKNNVNVAAIGEYNNRYPMEKGHKNIVYINIGIGIGAGIILNGKLYSGKNNAAGEIGFCCFKSLYDPCPDKDAGSFEKTVSVKYLLERYNLLVEEERQLGIRNQDVSKLFDRYDKQEKEAQQIIGELIENMLMLLISLTAILNIELIIFGGGLGERMKKYFMIFEKAIKKSVPFAPIIRVARLGTLSGVHGAVNKAISEVLKNYKNLQ